MDDWRRILILSAGGALGVNARFWLGVAMDRRAGPRFPWATFAINVSGSFAIGVAAVLLAHRWPHPLVRLFVVTGFLGGYTTFSAFAFESLTIWERGDRGLSLANVFGSVASGLAAVALGVALARGLVAGPPAPPEDPATGAGLNPEDDTDDRSRDDRLARGD